MEAEEGHSTACWRWRDLRKGQSDVAQTIRVQPKIADERAELLRVEEVKKYFAGSRGSFSALTRGTKGAVKAVDGVSLRASRAQTVGIVGESGCGKTTLVRTIIGLTPPTSGKIMLEEIAKRI